MREDSRFVVRGCLHVLRRAHASIESGKGIGKIVLAGF
jgi:hypothetical protein